MAPQTISVLDDPESTAEERVAACRNLIRTGELGRAVTCLSAMLEDPALRQTAKALLEHVRTLQDVAVGAAGPPRQDRAMEAEAEDLGYSVVPASSSTTIISFTGKAERFDLSIYFMQRILKRFGVNVIHVFDWNNTYYFTGVRGLGNDSRSTAARLQEICASLGTKRLICLGQSSGGYAAIRYGAKLKADGVLAFSPIVLSVLGEPALDRIGAAIGRPPKLRSVDLRQILIREREEAPYTKIVYGDRNRADVLSARHLAGLPRVVAHPLPGVKDHKTVKVTALLGIFPEIFDAFCDEVGPGQWASRQRGISSRKSRGRPARARPRSPEAKGSPR